MTRNLLREATFGLVAVAAVIGVVLLTYSDKMPTEVLAGVVSMVITYLVKERETNAVRKSWEEWHKENHVGT